MKRDDGPERPAIRETDLLKLAGSPDKRRGDPGVTLGCSEGAVEPVIIQVSRAEVESNDPRRVVAILDSFAPLLFERNRNRVRLEVLGYLDDRRELWDVPEVRTYYQSLFDATDPYCFGSISISSASSA